MDLHSRIAAGLADFDDLLMHGVSIEAALEVAAAENGISMEVLRARASRDCTLDERQRQIIRKVELAREVAERKKANAIGSLFVAAFEAERLAKAINLSGVNDAAVIHANETTVSIADHQKNLSKDLKEKAVKREQLKFDL